LLRGGKAEYDGALDLLITRRPSSVKFPPRQRMHIPRQRRPLVNIQGFRDPTLWSSSLGRNRRGNQSQNNCQFL
ncbi:MAG: hypothetical protein ACRD4I_18175, partial [Candidatus Angelobacter sp.]